jgi:hypothetical protein
MTSTERRIAYSRVLIPEVAGHGQGVPIVVLPATATVTSVSGAAMETVALPAPGWAQPALDTRVRV